MLNNFKVKIACCGGVGLFCFHAAVAGSVLHFNQNIDKSDSKASYFVDSIKDTIKVIVS
mgnify:CR=1 FL=1